MVRKESIQQVRGTRDVLPDEYDIRRKVSQEIIKAFELYGYRGIEVPTIEPVELHLCKSGEAIRQHMYTFQDKGKQQICLRPEFTASLVRMFNDKLQNEPLPLRLYYIGSAFRYDRPQAGRYREFTQAGIEIIGGKKEEYDAEIIALACHIMNSLKIFDYKVIIGNIGIILELLSKKKISERLKGFFLENLEQINKAESKEDGIKKIEESLSNMLLSPLEDVEVLASLKKLPEKEIENVITWLIKTIYQEDKNRESREIAQNILKKMYLKEQSSEIKEIVKFIKILTNIEGSPPFVFKEVEKLLEEYNLSKKPLDELRNIVDYLNYYNIDWSKIEISFGFGRGLEYYTGMIFEIHSSSSLLGESQKQVCGGGRYDTLISDLGGNRNIPALGFSFGLERLVLCLKEKDTKGSLNAFIGAIGGNHEFNEAIRIATILRKNEIKTYLGPKGLGASQLAGMAKRLCAKFLIFIGSEELERGFLTIKNMNNLSKGKYPLEEVIKIIKNG